MAVFMDTGSGDIYAGPTREEVIAQMQADLSDFDISKAFLVPATMEMVESDEFGNETGDMITLEEEYNPAFGVYCIASDNC